MSQGKKLTKTACITKPALTISWLAWSKIWKLTENNKEKGKFYECTSLGIMDPRDPCRLLDIFVPEQDNTATSTVVEEDDQMDWLAECVASGIDPGQLVFWHHSHADMDVFWSGTDVDNINRYDGDNIQWSMVTNASGEYKIRADLFSPLRYWWDDCECTVEYPQIELEDWWSVTKKKLNNKTYTVTKKYTQRQVATSNKRPVTSRVSSNHWWDHSSNGWDYHDGNEPFYRYDYQKEEESAQAVASESSSTEWPYEVLSDPKLQEAYDEERVTHEQALDLEHRLLCDSLTQEEFGERLNELEKQNLQDLIGIDLDILEEDKEGKKVVN